MLWPAASAEIGSRYPAIVPSFFTFPSAPDDAAPAALPMTEPGLPELASWARGGSGAATVGMGSCFGLRVDAENEERYEQVGDVRGGGNVTLSSALLALQRGEPLVATLKLGDSWA